MSGKVYLVGAGPGDPGLLTIKGLECIKSADVIVYDFLASPELLKHASESAEIIYAGKKSGKHSMPQNGINDLIVKKASEGLTVTRLKGGDPFIFGRGGEEAEALIREGLDFEIVPGVTSAIAAPAYAGIPLTHRKYASAVAFVTGHEDPGKDKTRIDWTFLSKGTATIVFLMGVNNLPNITRQLIENGKPQNTPVALIRWGTTPDQFTVTGTLDTIVERVEKAGLKAPAIIIVGEVVNLREKLQWFENRPLTGKRIVVTRAREQASNMVKMLSDLGAACLEFPTIKVVPPDDWNPLDRAINNLSEYDWLVFTSVNGVKYFFERLFRNDLDARSLNNLKTAAIGPATEKELIGFGLKSDIVPVSYRAESIVDAFRDMDIRGRKILLPRAEDARQVLPVELRKMGALVDETTAYCTETVEGNKDLLLKHLKDKTVDLITFTSSSTVRNFKALLPPERFEDLMRDIAVASIGPITAETARNLGFDVHIIADSFTIPDLCNTIVNHYKKV